MSALWTGIVIGVGGCLVIGLVAGCALDGEFREAVGRILLAPISLPALALLTVALPLAERLPKVSRYVTTDSLRDALDDERYENRTRAINWPRGALVLLRSKPKGSDS